ncbi:hypothetical protein F2P81_008921 [Scophthalmus maximus]|uniref:Uncharacterized protein n=1 Tax=Scophthalmus maximus TaxID=52904 RepID=A0A6A4SXW2_SCOMX|nr:hypothetical protein F2P81_008921 [Scophthalmus maximus]
MESEKKRRKYSTSSNDSDTTDMVDGAAAPCGMCGCNLHMSGDLVVQVIEEYGHQQHMGSSSAQETVRGVTHSARWQRLTHILNTGMGMFASKQNKLIVAESRFEKKVVIDLVGRSRFFRHTDAAQKRAADVDGVSELCSPPLDRNVSHIKNNCLFSTSPLSTLPSVQVFRTDFITAMKLPDSAQLGPDDFYVLSDPWRQEWEKGVQVPANLEAIPEPVVRLPQESASGDTLEREGGTRPPPTKLYSCYDLDDLDVAWLELVNQEFKQMALPELDELTMECVLVELESVCEEKMQQAIEMEEGLGIEYDEDVVCDVCRSPEGEDGNEMVFCDKCNVCVHQACYGILKVPQGNWLCRTCALGVQPKCLLCPKRGGALKPTRSGTKWVHVSCALWIPELFAYKSYI